MKSFKLENKKLETLYTYFESFMTITLDLK